MTVNDVIRGFFAEDEKNPERSAYANDLFQEAIRIGMELNNQYHTPEDIRMNKLGFGFLRLPQTRNNEINWPLNETGICLYCSIKRKSI